MVRKPYYFRCPRCGQRDDFRFLSTKSSDDGFGCLMLLFGGPLLWLLFSSKEGTKVICRKCDADFTKPSKPTSHKANLYGLLFAVLVVGWSMFLSYVSTNSLTAILPLSGWWADFARLNSEFVFKVLLVAAGLSCVLSILAWITERYTFDKSLARKYRL